MSLSDFIYAHFHEKVASLTAAGASVFAPLPDLLTRIVVGICVGVGTWVITKSISAGLAWLKKKSCK